MNPIIDTIMIILFVLFMLFIFVGYHNSKYLQRQKDDEKKRDSEVEKKTKSQ